MAMKMSNPVSGEVEGVQSNEHVRQNTTKVQKLESNIVPLKGENHQQVSSQEKLIPVVYNNSESNVNSKILINDSVSIATHISKYTNNRVEQPNNVIMFNIKEQDNKQKCKEVVSDLCSFIIGKETPFKCTRLGTRLEQIIIKISQK